MTGFKLEYRWELVLWLAVAFFFNQADRQIYHVVMPLIRADLGLSDVQLGAVASVFSLVLAVSVPFAGYAGDRFSKGRIATGSFFFWSLASVLTGFAPGFAGFLIFRSLATGIGEGVHAPSAYALISQQHLESRGRAMAFHQSSVYMGIVAAGLAGGYMGQVWGWRTPFWVFGGTGLVLSLLMARRIDLSTSLSSEAGMPYEPRSALSSLLRSPSAGLLTMAFSSMVFVNAGVLTWTPTYLHERFGLGIGAAGLVSMLSIHAAAFAGVFLSGRMSDGLALRTRPARAAIQAAGLVGVAPFLLLLSETGEISLAVVGLVGIGFFRGVYEANIYAALHDVVPARYHATGSSAMICVAYLLGAIAPVALGAIKQESGLGAGLGWLTFALAPGAVAALTTWRFTYASDHAKAIAG
jgi:MFS family permease